MFLTKINVGVLPGSDLWGNKSDDFWLRREVKKTTFEVVFPSSKVVAPPFDVVQPDYEALINKASDPEKTARCL